MQKGNKTQIQINTYSPHTKAVFTGGTIPDVTTV